VRQVDHLPRGNEPEGRGQGGTRCRPPAHVPQFGLLLPTLAPEPHFCTWHVNFMHTTAHAYAPTHAHLHKRKDAHMPKTTHAHTGPGPVGHGCPGWRLLLQCLRGGEFSTVKVSSALLDALSVHWRRAAGSHTL